MDSEGAPVVTRINQKRKKGKVDGQKFHKDDDNFTNEKPLAKRMRHNTQQPSASVGSNAVHESENVDEELQLNKDIAKMDGSLLSDYIARQLHRFEPNMSILELKDLIIPAQALQDIDSFFEKRVLKNLPSFLESNTKKTKSMLSIAPSNALGSPHTVVVTLSAMRAANITRILRLYQTEENKIGKLFAKHIKLKQAIEFTKKTRMNMVVGTPQRMHDLVEQGALSLDRVDTVVIDGSHVNAKRRGIFEQHETLLPLLKFVSRLDLKDIPLKSTPQSKILVF